jgi:hypothetical protein
MISRRAFKPRIENSHRADEWKRCEPFLKWLKTRPCLISVLGHGADCSGPVRACHFDPRGDKGMATKVSDSACMPMCNGPDSHHEEQHRVGWPAFQSKYGFDGRDAVTAYWLEWLDGTSMGAAWKRRMEEA